MDFSEEVNLIAGYALDEAMRTGCRQIGTDHLALGMLRHADNTATDALQCLEVDLSEFKDFVESQLFEPDAVPYTELSDVHLSPEAQATLRMATLAATTCGTEEVLAIHLLMAIAHSVGTFSRKYLDENGISHSALEPYAAKKKTEPAKAPSEKFISIAVGGSIPS